MTERTGETTGGEAGTENRLEVMQDEILRLVNGAPLVGAE